MTALKSSTTMSRFQIAIILSFLIVQIGNAQSVDPGIDPGGGGGVGQPQLTVKIIIEPDGSPIIIGTTVTFTYTTTGTGPWTTEWFTRCGPGAEEGPEPWAAIDKSTPFHFCFQSEGSFHFKLRVTDVNGAQGEDTLTIVVLGPNLLELDDSAVSNPSIGPGSILSLVHHYYAKRDDKNVNECWLCDNTTVYEFAAFVLNYNNEPGHEDDEWGPDAPENPEDWAAAGGLEGCSSTDNSGFFWFNPYIYDKKSMVDPGYTWDDLPVGHVLKRYKHWVAIKVPICGDPEKSHHFVILGPIIFEIRVAEGKRIVHVRIN